MNICTIVAKNYVAHARVLARSFLATHPDGECAVLVVDDYEGYLDPAEEPFELIGLGEIGLPDAERMAASYDVTEFSTAVKPWLLRYLLERDGVEAVTYLDPDILVTDSLLEVEELALANGIVLTPHFTAPLPRDSKKPSEEDILIAGAYNLGFIALGASETADELLDWWAERLEKDCVIDPGGGLFVDQRWIDLVPGIWPQVNVLRDPGFNIAYWNLPTRKLESDGEGYRVDGHPLRFFHFSGFDPAQPTNLSKHQNRIEVEADPALRRICGEYAELLLDAGQREARGWSYGWDSLPNGLTLDSPARRVYREAIESGAFTASIFSRRGAERFTEYLREVPTGASVNRYAKALWECRPDLRRAFPNLEGRDAAGLNRWLFHNAEKIGLAPQLRPDPKQELGPAGVRDPRQLGVNLAGYMSAELGVGEAARQVGKALAARQVPGPEIDVPVAEADFAAAFAELVPEDHPHDVNLICVNADMLPAVAGALPPRFFQDRCTAGLWFWEVERFPDRWRDSFKYLDEVWTASEFVADALRPLAPIPVSTIRVPVTPVEPTAVDREALSLPEGFCFLYIFDYRSVFRRKNPLGAIEAFRNAFDPGDGASLVIKSVGDEAWPLEAERLAAAAEHPDVHLIDGVLPPAEKNAMIAACDSYLSLHRSEGLGLTMAEAMYFGKPVIATGYSGNLDFMTDENAYLVDYELVEIGEGAEPYPPAARWAEPNVEHAAELMREVFENQEQAARKGERAAATIRATHSPEAAGEVLEERLARLHQHRVVASSAASPGASWTPAAVPDYVSPGSGRALLDHLLEFEQAPSRPGSGPLRRFVKRLYMRFLRPYAAHERRLDLSLREAIDELAFELAALQRRAAGIAELKSDLSAVDEHLRGLDGDVRGAYAVQAAELKEVQAKLEALEQAFARNGYATAEGKAGR